jgi:hypothetical protein
MCVVIGELSETVAARWLGRLRGDSADRAHWRTKTSYYEVALRLVRSGQPDFGWKDVVDAHRHGARTTFYDVAGPSSRRPLVRDYRDVPDLWLRAAVDRYGASAAAWLLAETKVWSFWPYREGWLTELAARTVDPGAAGRALARVYGAWQYRWPLLAATDGGEPPLCVLEDLHLLRPDLPGPRDARAELDSAGGDLAGVYERGWWPPADLEPPAAASAGPLGKLVGVCGDLAAMRPGVDRDLAVELIQDAVDLLTGEAG